VDEAFVLNITGRQSDVDSFARHLRSEAWAKTVHIGESSLYEPPVLDTEDFGQTALVTALITITTSTTAGLATDALKNAFRSFANRRRRMKLNEISPVQQSSETDA